MANLLNNFRFTGSIAMAAIIAGASVTVGVGGVVAAQPGQTARAPQSHSAGSPLVLKSVSVELPTSGRTFPDGPGAEEINNNCLTCHSAGMVLNQPALPEAVW